jgi:hypothetical protein
MANAISERVPTLFAEQHNNRTFSDSVKSQLERMARRIEEMDLRDSRRLEVITGLQRQVEQLRLNSSIPSPPATDEKFLLRLEVIEKKICQVEEQFRLISSVPFPPKTDEKFLLRVETVEQKICLINERLQIIPEFSTPPKTDATTSLPVDMVIQKFYGIEEQLSTLEDAFSRHTVSRMPTPTVDALPPSSSTSFPFPLPEMKDAVKEAVERLVPKNPFHSGSRDGEALSAFKPSEKAHVVQNPRASEEVTGLSVCTSSSLGLAPTPVPLSCPSTTHIPYSVPTHSSLPLSSSSPRRVNSGSGCRLHPTGGAGT